MRTILLSSIACLAILNAAAAENATTESLASISGQLARESNEAYEASPYAALSKDYFLRFSRDTKAHFADFMDRRMGVILPTEKRSRADSLDDIDKAVVFLDSGGGNPDVAESFTITVKRGEIRVVGRDARGLRDGIVRLVDRIGFRQAPILPMGEQVYTPRLAVRLGAVPKFGSYRELVFMGYNATFVGGGSLHALSTSDAIPELVARQRPGALEAGVRAAEDARRHGLKTYCFINTRQKFPKDDPVFRAHPEIRGALTWKADGEYVLCTEHPLVRRYLAESVTGIFRADPALDGLVVIIGGEGFYHCFMRPYGTAKGHTNCNRCEALGAETVVANLCNLLSEAARSVNPKAELIAWPYSAEHVWSADKAQVGFIRRLKPGCAIFTEIEKDEFVQKPDGVRKHLWDYSIDLIG
ncbi:MAG: hypothetical protein AMJ84_12295, partial [Acidithiobacillales bacterium SM23_46]